MPRIVYNFSKLKDADLILTAETIRLAMTANVHFPSPSPALDSLLIHTNAFAASLKATVQTGDKTKMDSRNELKQKLVNTLEELADYVTRQANGNALLLISSGYTIIQPGTITTIGAPKEIQAQKGTKSGDVQTSVNPVLGAQSYLHQYTSRLLAETNQWICTLSTKCKNTFTGLEPGKRYWFRVATIGLNNQVIYSGIVSRIIE